MKKMVKKICALLMCAFSLNNNLEARHYHRGYHGDGYGAALAIPAVLGTAAIMSSAASRDRDYYPRESRRDRNLLKLRKRRRTIERELDALTTQIDDIKSKRTEGNLDRLMRRKERLEKQLEEINDKIDDLL